MQYAHYGHDSKNNWTKKKSYLNYNWYPESVFSCCTTFMIEGYANIFTDIFSIWVLFTAFLQFAPFLSLLRLRGLFASTFSFTRRFRSLFSTPSPSCFFSSLCFRLLSFKSKLLKDIQRQFILFSMKHLPVWYIQIKWT